MAWTGSSSGRRRPGFPILTACARFDVAGRAASARPLGPDPPHGPLRCDEATALW